MSEPRGGGFKGLAVALSLANLLALHVWLDLFRTAREVPQPWTAYAGAIVALAGLTGALWLVAALARRIPIVTLRRGVTLAAWICVWLLVVWAALKPSSPQAVQYLLGIVSPEWAAVCGALLIAGVLSLLWRHDQRVTGALALLALVLCPYAFVNIAQAAWKAVVLPPLHGAPTVDVPMLQPGEHRRRTVVLLFDEFDYQLAFEPGVRRDPLPVMDGLRTRALFATQAYPPMHSTVMSLPAMLTGHLVESGVSSPTRPGDIDLRFSGGRVAPFSAETTLFTAVRERGMSSLRMNDALLPQERLAGNADADIVVPPAGGLPLTVRDHAANHLVTVATLIPLGKRMAIEARLGTLLGLVHPSVHVSLVADQMVDLAGAARCDLLFLHILLPHLPVVFDQRHNRFGAIPSADYRDNLLGVDQVVGRVMARLRDSGRLEDTHVVVLSDHFYRLKRASHGVGDHRVPFIARFAGDPTPVGDFVKPFNMVLARGMLEGMVFGSIRNSADMARWIDAHATFGESPLTEYRKGW